MQDLILKGLGKRKVKAILNKWIKDQVNTSLAYGYGKITLDPVIWLEEYVEGMEEQEDSFEVSALFEFIGGQI